MEYPPLKDITESWLYFHLLHTISYSFTYIFHSVFYLSTSTPVWQVPQTNPHRYPFMSIFVILLLCCCCCSVVQPYLTLCDPMDCSMPDFPVLHHLLALDQTHIHWVNDAIQPSHPLLPPSPAFNLSQDQGLFQWVTSSHQVAKVLEFQPQHQSFEWTCWTGFL